MVFIGQLRRHAGSVEGEFRAVNFTNGFGSFIGSLVRISAFDSFYNRA